MIKMQIKMDEAKIQKDGRYDLSKINKALDDFFIDRLHVKKSTDGFYIGTGAKDDFGNFALAMWTLGKKRWFMDNVDTWLYFNSEDSDDPSDFVIEDFKTACLNYYKDRLSA